MLRGQDAGVADSGERSGARVEIDRATLTRLLVSGQMHVCELRCLDAESKQLLRRLTLRACTQGCQQRDN